MAFFLVACLSLLPVDSQLKVLLRVHYSNLLLVFKCPNLGTLLAQCIGVVNSLDDVAYFGVPNVSYTLLLSAAFGP